jgi:glycerol kinase
VIAWSLALFEGVGAMTQHLLAIDQGTTSTRSILFDCQGAIVAQAQQAHQQHCPQSGWVEHDPDEIWQATSQTMQAVLQQAAVGREEKLVVGISNQRETTVLWHRKTGKPIYAAIVWQDRRTAAFCQQLIDDGCEPMIQAKTGLVIDPYFSASKLAWLLDHVPHARKQAEQGLLAFGTIDCFLLWRLSGGRAHKTDATNASRTLLFDIHQQCWDKALLDLFKIPEVLLPEVCDSSAVFADLDVKLFGYHGQVTGMVGDQQAAAIGQGCIKKGMCKSTYGTGCFFLLNTGDQALVSTQRLLTTVAYRCQGEVSYAMEGSIFIAGAALQWLRDCLHLLNDAKQSEGLAQSIEDTGGVYLVPAFTGLGAPYWDPNARGALLGLHRDTSIAAIVRAALEACAYQTRDLVEAMIKDGAQLSSLLRVDGGMAANDWFLQYLADILALEVERPVIIEASAWGAALVAGLGAGIFSSLDKSMTNWHFGKKFIPKMTTQRRSEMYNGWLNAITCICPQENKR